MCAQATGTHMAVRTVRIGIGRPVMVMATDQLFGQILYGPPQRVGERSQGGRSQGLALQTRELLRPRATSRSIAALRRVTRSPTWVSVDEGLSRTRPCAVHAPFPRTRCGTPAPL